MNTKDRGLKSWLEWRNATDEGLAMEPDSVFPYKTIISLRDTDIECPHHYKQRNEWRQCKSRLMDTEIVIGCGTMVMRVTKCNVCGNWSCRPLGVVKV